MLNSPFAALRHKNFRYYSFGMLVSTTGTWMQNVAQPWLAYDLTGSPFLLSLVGAMQFLPVTLFALFAGVMIDRFPKKAVLLLTQAASFAVTLALALLVYSGEVRYWHLLVLSFLLGLATTLDMPARHAFAVEMVGPADLMNAIALNSTVFNLARVIGPAFAGILMGSIGLAACFFINAISYAVVFVSLLFIQPLTQVEKEPSRKGIVANIREGLLYIRQTRDLLQTFVLIAIVGMFAPNFGVLVPVFAREVLGLAESGFGFLMSALGIGSLAGALAIASMSRTGPSRKILYWGPLATGAWIVAAGMTSQPILTALGLALAGFAFILFNTSGNSTLQLTTRDEYRGRVMSVYALVLGGTSPLGNLYAGLFAEHLGARAGFYACGLAILVLVGLKVLLLDRVAANVAADRARHLPASSADESGELR
ncbi:MAG: MFS transporter [Clostridia bacterium]|nr:MFS transporter [Clostridia bacterium]